MLYLDLFIICSNVNLSYFILANEDSSGSVGTDAPYVIKVVRDSVYLFIVANSRYVSRV